MTKLDKVANYLKEHGKITQAECVTLFRGYRLAVIISNLRHKRGWDIETIFETSKDAEGNVSRYAVYELVEEGL